MPNVPNVPGVPALSSYSSSPVILLAEDLVASLLGLFTPAWGIFLNGVAAVEADNTVSFELAQDYPISTYPVEQGAFQSYDKVQLPFDVKVTMSAGGSVTNRQAFIASVRNIVSSINLYDVVTPETVFSSCNVVHWGYKRDKMTAGLVIVDIWMEEVRVSSSVQFSNTQSPTAQSPTSLGNVQPAVPSVQTAQYFSAFS